MQKVETRDDSREHGGCLQLAALSKAELEPIVIAAMREHRQFMESDEIVFDEWQRSKADSSIPFSQVEILEAECLARRNKSLIQQDRLSDLLDLLGYIPKVPEDCREES